MVLNTLRFYKWRKFDSFQTSYITNWDELRLEYACYIKLGAVYVFHKTKWLTSKPNKMVSAIGILQL